MRRRFSALLDVLKRAHVVQPVGELHQQHANVVGDRQHQLAEILRLLGALREQFQLRQLGHAVDEVGDLLAEIGLDVVVGGERVLDRVVQQRGDDGRHVELEIRQDRGDFQRMGEVRIARGAELLAVRLHGVDIRLVQQRLVGVGIVGLDAVDELGLAHQTAAGRSLGRRHRRNRGNRLCLSRAFGLGRHRCAHAINI